MTMSMSRCWDKVSKAPWLPRNILGLDAAASGSHGSELHKSQETTFKVLRGCEAYVWPMKHIWAICSREHRSPPQHSRISWGAVNDLESQPGTASYKHQWGPHRIFLASFFRLDSLGEIFNMQILSIVASICLILQNISMAFHCPYHNKQAHKMASSRAGRGMRLVRHLVCTF